MADVTLATSEGQTFDIEFGRHDPAMRAMGKACEPPPDAATTKRRIEPAFSNLRVPRHQIDLSYGIGGQGRDAGVKRIAGSCR